MNVIFHIDEEKRQPPVQGDITHMFVYCEQLQQDFHIEIVVNGRAIRRLKEEAAEQLEYKAVFCDLIKHSVVTVACYNAMKGQKVEEQGLLNGATAAASGVVELAVRQQARYFYIKL